MEPSEPEQVRLGVTPEGVLTYLVDRPLETMPAVRGRDLEAAWDAAREAALHSRMSSVRGFRFRRRDGTFTDLALADRDACCWAGAVDRTVGMESSYGLAVCLRLLALIDLLARARWAQQLLRLGQDGATLHPSLLRTAATAPLTSEARFDETGFRDQLPRFALDQPVMTGRLTGATA